MLKKIIKEVIAGILCLSIVALIDFLPATNSQGKEKWSKFSSEESTNTLPAISPDPIQDKNKFYSDMITSEIYSYCFIDEKKTKIAILQIDSKDSKLVIPSELDGHKVVRLGINVYNPISEDVDVEPSDASIVTQNTQENLKTLVISNGIEEIGCYAFFGCKQLSDLQLPEGDYRIGEGAFSNTNSISCLKRIKIPYRANLYDGVFNLPKAYDLEEVVVDSDKYGRYADEYTCFNHVNINNLVFQGKKGKSYDLFLFMASGTVNKMVINSSVKSLTLYKDQLSIKKMIVNGKKTKIKGKKTSSCYSSEYYPLYLKINTIYTVNGAKVISWAKKNKVTYKTKKAEKVSGISSKKSRKKYKHNWKSAVTKVETYKYKNKKWKKSVKKIKTIYRVYGKKKNGKYKYIGETKTPGFVSGYQKIRVKTDVNW